jgi:outer membrane protein OmpA-like peptidoglycan-associated protein
MNKVKKVIICLTGCFLLALGSLQAQDDARPMADSSRQPQAPATDTARQAREASSVITSDSTAPAVRDTAAHTQDTTALPKDTASQAAINPAPTDNNSARTKQDTKPAGDSTTPEKNDLVRQLDTRWFISPLLKLQFQDFAFLEKNRKGYLSDANNLPFFNRGNASFAASAYKNITGRLSLSADLGLSFGHVTNDNVLISQTKSKTYNLLGAALYYHLLPASYRLQPYITIGINDIINEASYVSAPIGIGAKFNASKVMVMGQITYGYGVSKNISNTTMYGLGVYIPINNKKHKQLEADDQTPYNRRGKDEAKKKDDSTGNRNGGITINVIINMDSVFKARGLDGRDGRDGNDGRSARKTNSDEGDDASDGASGNGNANGGNGKKHRSSGLRSMNLEDFSFNDFKMDTIDGRPVIRFVVYFEFNEYSLTSKAFGSIDKVVSHLKQNPHLAVEIKGYTDDVGSDEYNNFLSRRRAKMVLDYMNSRGVPSELIKAKAYGSDNPVGDNKDPNQAWLNRRAEIIVHEK